MTTNLVKGKTLVWTFEDGPMAGKTFEHKFGTDGSLTWRSVDGEDAAPAKDKGKKADDKPSKEKKYEAERVSDRVCAVSYLGTSGWTLTTVLDFDDGTLVAFASNDKQLTVQHGTFQEADAR